MSQQPSPFDGKLFIAIGITLALWIGYQSYLQKKYPDAYKPKAVATADSSEQAPGQASLPTTGEKQNTSDVASAKNTNGSESNLAEPNISETTLPVDDEHWRLEFSSRGLAVKSIELKEYTDREGKLISFDGLANTSNFETSLIGNREPINFKMEYNNQNQVSGVAHIGQMRIRKTIILDSSEFTLNTLIEVENPSDNFTGLVTKIAANVHPKKGGSFFAPNLDHQEFFIEHDESDSRVSLSIDTESKENFPRANLVALASQYFALAIVDKSDVVPEFQAASLVLKTNSGSETVAVGSLTHQMLNRSDSFRINYQSYAGPKLWKRLESANKNLPAIINFGFFKTIAGWIFKLLLSIHAAVGNWGVAIILLTLLVRALVLPFNVMSYRSMKAMSKIQPQLKTVREKYKNDSAKANQEIMRIMKESKANPLGGCLPIFLQIPVFFALYQVLGQSIELYKAPFIFWINDLSQPDRFFVFPVLMGITMFIQQKITPSTLEPAQQKILLFMPIFLTVVMAGLPSGLTLYMFVSTLFGVSQQLYFMKDDKKREAAA